MRWIAPVLLGLASIPTAALADDWSFVFYSDQGPSSFGSGEVQDFSVASRHRDGRAPMLYVRQGGSAYVIRNADILAKASAIMARQRELGRKQGDLGEQQAALGERQARLGAEQGRLGEQMAGASPQQMAARSSRLAVLGRQQVALGKEQAALGALQADLGRKQAREAAIARPRLRALVAAAVRAGLAVRVD